MKIDEGCINHNVVRLTDSNILRLIGAEVDRTNKNDYDEQERDRLITLGFIQGVLTLGEELKKVLRT